MNNKALTLSLLMAVFAVLMVSSYVTSVEEKVKKDFGTPALVITAARDIREAETINETMFSLTEMPKKFREPAAIELQTREEAKAEFRKLENSVAIVPIKKGEQISWNKISEPGIRTGLAAQVAPGKRAVAVPVGETTGVAKLVKPGDRVDLIAIIDSGKGKETRIAKTILQDVVVLAVGRSISGNVPRSVEVDTITGKDRVRSLAEDFSFASVTLEVEPAQAQTVALILNGGADGLTLSLRNNDDTDRQMLPATALPDVIGVDAARIPQNNGVAGHR